MTDKINRALDNERERLMREITESDSTNSIDYFSLFKMSLYDDDDDLKNDALGYLPYAESVDDIRLIKSLVLPGYVWAAAF